MVAIDKGMARGERLSVQLIGDGELRVQVRAVLAALREPRLEVLDAKPPAEPAVAAPGGRNQAARGTDVAMVIMNGAEEQALEVLERQHASVPRPAIFVLANQPSPELMRRALRAGADEILFLPLDRGDVTRALLKVSEANRRTERKRGAKVISLASLAGGVGVTSLTANLALSLHRQFGRRCALVDLDFQSATLGVHLNLEPEHTIVRVVGQETLDSIRLESALTKHASGVYLLAAPKRIEDGDSVTEASVGAALDVMAQMFDFVLIDCGCRIDTSVVAAWERSSHLLYLLDQSVASARCAWRFIDVFGRLQLPALQPQFVLSKSTSGHPVTAEQIANTLSRPIAAVIPRDDAAMQRVELTGRDLWEVAPGSPLAASIDELARVLADERAETSAERNGGGAISRLLSAIVWRTKGNGDEAR
jgi:pilus assembly protein CpaE